MVMEQITLKKQDSPDMTAIRAEGTITDQQAAIEVKVELTLEVPAGGLWLEALERWEAEHGFGKDDDV
jgi:hypothetical protein